MRFGRLALVAVAGLLTAAAGTALAVTVAAATGGSVSWFPAIEHHPLRWTAGSTAAVAAAGLLLWWAQRWYDAGRREVIPIVQRPEAWVAVSAWSAEQLNVHSAVSVRSRTGYRLISDRPNSPEPGERPSSDVDDGSRRSLSLLPSCLASMA